MEGIELIGRQVGRGKRPLVPSLPKNRAQATAVRPAKTSDKFISGGIIDLRRDSIHARLPPERFPQRRRDQLMLFEDEESGQPSRVKEVERRPELSQAFQR